MCKERYTLDSTLYTLDSLREFRELLKIGLALF